MVRLPRELYACGVFIAVTNLALTYWFGGLFAIPLTFSAVALILTLGWSALGAPGVEHLTTYVYDRS